MSLKDQYFRHDYTASEDDKIILMLHEMGMESYGIFWYICERAAKAGGILSLKIIPALAEKMKVDIKKVESVVKKYDLFKVNGETFSSDRLIGDLKHRKTLSKWGKEGGKESVKVRAGKTSATLPERQKAFYDKLVPFVGIGEGLYSKDMVRQFYEYWSEEHQQKKGKMLCETMDTFAIGRRLATWKKIDNKKNGNDGEDIKARNPEDNRPA
jgi:hypothetical protein